MKRIFGILLALIIVISVSVVCISAEDIDEEKILFAYDIYDSTQFGYDYVYAGIFAKYSEVNKQWTLEDFPGVSAYSVIDTQAKSEESAAVYIPPKNFHQILKFDIVEKTPEGCLAAIRALETSEYVKSVNPQVRSNGWDPITTPVDPSAGGFTTVGGWEETSTFIGDSNEDGSLDMKDVLFLRKNIAGLERLINFIYADVNFDGDVNMKDVLILRRMIAGIYYE